MFLHKREQVTSSVHGPTVVGSRWDVGKHKSLFKKERKVRPLNLVKWAGFSNKSLKGGFWGDPE